MLMLILMFVVIVVIEFGIVEAAAPGSQERLEAWAAAISIIIAVVELLVFGSFGVRGAEIGLCNKQSKTAE